MADSKGTRERWLVCLIGLALTLGTAVGYWPVRHFDFVNLDDTLYVTETPMVRQGLSWAGVGWAFKSVEGGNWNPLVWLSHMADCQLYGLKPEGHHLTNVAMHMANVLLLFLILRGMTGATWRSGLAAAIFAWHPMHVESVAWVSERKDVLSTLFWLLTILAYARYAREIGNRDSRFKMYYGLALVFFALGLMSKPMLVTLPVVLVLLDWWPLKRIAGRGKKLPKAKGAAKESKQEGTGSFAPVSLERAIMEKAPFFLMSAVGCVLAIWAQSKSEAMWNKPFMLRMENAAVSGATYVIKLFCPVKLAVFYPYPDSIAPDLLMGAVLLLGMITWCAFRQRRERPYLAAGWLWFLVTLLPVIGLVQVGMQSMADRYTYVPYMGLGLMVSWGLGEMVAVRPGWRMAIAGLVGAGLLCGVVMTRAQTYPWENSHALYAHALKVTTGNHVAHENVANELMEDGKIPEAVEHFKEVIRLTPEAAKPYNELGKAYLRLRKMDDAMLMFSNASRLNPGLAQARWNLGNSYLLKGDTTRALAEMKAGVELSPDDVEAHRRLGDFLIKLGRPAESAPYWEMVVKALPKDAHAHFGLGTAYIAEKQFEKAVAEYKEALRESPDSPQCLNALAWIYATSPKAELRNGGEAVRLAERACALTQRQQPGMLDTLAAAYAEADKFEDAIKTAEEAKHLALATKDTGLANTIDQRLQSYQAGNPFRDEP